MVNIQSQSSIIHIVAWTSWPYKGPPFSSCAVSGTNLYTMAALPRFQNTFHMPKKSQWVTSLFHIFIVCGAWINRVCACENIQCCYRDVIMVRHCVTEKRCEWAPLKASALGQGEASSATSRCMGTDAIFSSHFLSSIREYGYCSTVHCG